MRALLIVLSVLEVVLVVGVLAFYLIRIASSLHRTVGYLSKVTFGVRAIESQTASIGEVVPAINRKLSAIASALGSLAARADGGAARRGSGA